jgi:hypothetical protein
MLKKTTQLLAIVFLSVLVIASQAQGKKGKTTSSSANDEAQIKALIENETKAFFEIDQKGWANCWANVPYAFWSFADTTDVNSFSGWDEIYKGFDNYFKTSKPSTAKIKRDWHHIVIKGNFAYVRFTQLVSDESLRPSQAEVRVMEKINGLWKIVCVSVIAIQKENVPIR